MKQYTSNEQTAKLIELGFEKPKSVISYSYPAQSEEQQAYEASLGLDPYIATVDQIEFEYAYSIGELLSFLPKEIKVGKYPEPAYLQMLYDEENVWEVGYTFYGNGMYIKSETEFIDCLFQMCIKLKKEGVI